MPAPITTASAFDFTARPSFFVVEFQAKIISEKELRVKLFIEWA
jgi:hypothetical protein